MSAHAFEFTPAGVVPLGTHPTIGDPSAPSGAAVPRALHSVANAEPLFLPIREVPGILEQRAWPPAPAAPVTAKQLLAAARARLRELDRDVPRLIAERDELRRLLDAARPPRKRRPADVAPPRATGDADA